jgi:hypothetical protein
VGCSVSLARCIVHGGVHCVWLRALWRIKVPVIVGRESGIVDGSVLVAMQASTAGRIGRLMFGSRVSLFELA